MNDDVQASRHGGLDPVDESLRRARELLRAVATLTGDSDLAGQAVLRDPRAALARAESAIVQALTRSGERTVRAQLAAALSQVTVLLSRLREARLEARSAAIEDLHRSLARLRAAGSVADLVDQAPIELNRLGYQRSLFCRLSGPNWSPRSAFAHADPQLAHDLVEIGTAVPGQLGRELPETEVVRTRTPVLVEDAQHNPRVHHRLINLARTRDYVVAPLIGRGEVIGLVHADRHAEAGGMTAFDVRLMGLFAEGLGCVLERVVFAEQLRRLRDQLTEQARSVDELIDGFGGLGEPGPTPGPDPLGRLDGPFAELTRRELDVLRHLVKGRTNSQIAAELFVSPGTVKTHVKNVFRKLGVANRAEASARYHALTRHNR
ncbi:GAF domain-containing protein [Amycolatopsis sp. K13G38]|uniref:GAF domain-containing protein n=1 Tax=Amycolatopsis acididurans TaxID=2724524 RepID=A0ABX1J6T3_9PSEU|nr:LuxR C-terminal-related transcriptional regulator [Amycolatopsis acididurans]NKQ54046.1 GAF domain-containing protein [Amycolatopsis acididurans]